MEENPEPRKVLKGKRRVQQDSIAAPDDVSLEDSQEDFLENEDIVQRDNSDEEAEGQWVSDGDSDSEPMKAKQAKKVWNDNTTPLKEDEELIYDGSAYQMLHRSKVEWPCLSIDWLLRERCGASGVQA